MKIIRVIDKYNLYKEWIIKKYSNGTYYFNQVVYGTKLNKKFTRTTKKYLIDVLGKEVIKKCLDS